MLVSIGTVRKLSLTIKIILKEGKSYLRSLGDDLLEGSGGLMARCKVKLSGMISVLFLYNK